MKAKYLEQPLSTVDIDEDLFMYVKLMVELQPLLAVGKMIFQQCGKKIVQIEDGIVVKHGESVSLYEAEVIKYISSKSNITVPKIYSFFKHGKINYIIMDEIRGVTLESIWESLPDSNKTKAVGDILDIISQLQKIQSPTIGDLKGGPCPDMFFDRLADDGVRVVGSGLDFNKFILQVLQRKHTSLYHNLLVAGLSKNSSIVFTHSNLVPRNIMVSSENNNIVAVLDWKFAGFYPEFWEYHKCLYSVNWISPWVSSFLQLMPANKKTDVALITTIRRFT